MVIVMQLFAPIASKKAIKKELPLGWCSFEFFPGNPGYNINSFRISITMPLKKSFLYTWISSCVGA